MIAVSAMIQAAAAAVPKAAAQAVANTSGGEGVTLTAMGIGLCYVQRYLKSFSGYQKFVAAFPGANKWAHRFVAGLSTFLVAVGFGYSLDFDPTRGGQLVITLPALSGLFEGLKHWGWMYLMQQYAYDSTKEGPVPAPANIVPGSGVPVTPAP